MKIIINSTLKRFLKKIIMMTIINYDKILLYIKFNKRVSEDVIFISEKNDWAIRQVGLNITSSLNKRKNGFIKFTTTPKNFEKKVIHFGSQYMWVDWCKNLPRNNHYIVSFFHGKAEDGEDVKLHISQFLKTVPLLTTIIVSSSIVKKRLISWGVPAKKISLIPIGVNNAHFVPTKISKKNEIRKQYGIKKKTIVIGSFQKDGIGWGNGELPKLIKGPDIFIQVIKRLKEQGFDVLIFLTGPARGYIKKELSKIKVNYIHKFFKNQNDLLKCYHALDLYLITSREEGGPMGLMEAMASGVPVVSTPVGMSVDLIQNNFSGKISKDFKVKSISKLICELIENRKLYNKITKNALSVVDEVSWANVSYKHYEDVYMPLIKKLIL